MQTRIIIVLGILMNFMQFSCAAQGNLKIQYKTIKIANLEWMAENLNVSFFSNGDPIPEAKTDEEWVKAGKEGKPAFCCYENKIENGDKCGKLYNWYAVTDPRGIGPKGWHVSSDDEWRLVTDFLGGEDAAGTKMKSNSGWKPDENGTNESGFSGLPGGCRDLNGKFSNMGDIGFWWTTTQWDTNLAWYRCIDKTPWYVYRTNYYKQNGFAIRNTA